MKNDLSKGNTESFYNFHVDDHHSRHVIKSHNAIRTLLEFITCQTVIIIPWKLKWFDFCSSKRYGYTTFGDILENDIWTVFHKELNI